MTPLLDIARRRLGITRLRDDVRRTFASDHGKRVLTWLIAHCHMHETSVTETFETNETMFREGEKSVVLDILSFLQKGWTADEFLKHLEDSRKVMADYFPDPDDDQTS